MNHDHEPISRRWGRSLRAALVGLAVIGAGALVLPAPATADTATDYSAANYARPQLMTQFRKLVADDGSTSASQAQSSFNSAGVNHSWIYNFDQVGSSSGEVPIISSGYSGTGVTVPTHYFELIPVLTDPNAVATTPYSLDTPVSFLNGQYNATYDAAATPTGSFVIGEINSAIGSPDQPICLGPDAYWGNCTGTVGYWHLVPSATNDGSYQIEQSPDPTAGPSNVVSNTCLVKGSAPDSLDPSMATATCRASDGHSDSYYETGDGQVQAQSWFLPGKAETYGQPGDTMKMQVNVPSATLPALDVLSAAQLTNWVNVCNWSATTINYALMYTYSGASGNGYYIERPDTSGNIYAGQCFEIDMGTGYDQGAIAIGESGGAPFSTYYFNGAGVKFTAEVYGASSDDYSSFHANYQNEGSVKSLSVRDVYDTSGAPVVMKNYGDLGMLADYVYLNWAASNPNIEMSYHPDLAEQSSNDTSWTSVEAKFMSVKIFGCIDRTCSNPFANRGVPSVGDSIKAYFNLTAPAFEGPANTAVKNTLDMASAAKYTDWEFEVMDTILF